MALTNQPTDAELERCLAKLKGYQCVADDFEGMTAHEIATVVEVYAERLGLGRMPLNKEFITHLWSLESPSGRQHFQSYGSDDPQAEHYGELAALVVYSIKDTLAENEFWSDVYAMQEQRQRGWIAADLTNRS